MLIGSLEPKDNNYHCPLFVTFVGNSGKWICAEGPTAAAAEAHDPKEAAGGHTHPVPVALLCRRWAFHISGHLENSPNSVAKSTAFVSVSQRLFPCSLSLNYVFWSCSCLLLQPQISLLSLLLPKTFFYPFSMEYFHDESAFCFRLI